MRAFALATGRWLVGAVTYVGGLVLFFALVLAVLPRLTASFRSHVRQMPAMGVNSLPLIVLTSVFAGAVSTSQAAEQFLDCVTMRFPGAAPDDPALRQSISGKMRGPQTAIRERCSGL